MLSNANFYRWNFKYSHRDLICELVFDKLHPTYLFVFKCMLTVAHKNSNMLGYDREQTYSFGDLGHLNLEIRIHLNYKQMVYGYSNYQVVEVLKKSSEY